MKLVTAAKTNTYELTFLAAGSLTDSEWTKVQDTVRGLVKKHTGTIVSEAIWGKKSLAYAIRKNGKTQTEAYYSHLVLEFSTSEAQAFEHDVYLDTEILRHLFVIGEKPKKEEAKPAEEK
jgi:ribosomal protein S6